MLTERENTLISSAKDILANAIECDMTIAETEKMLLLANEIIRQRKLELLEAISKKEEPTLKNVLIDIPQSRLEKLPDELYIHTGHNYGFKHAIDFRALERTTYDWPCFCNNDR